MENGTELHKVIYNVFLTQIQFGAYRFGEKLPTMEETSARLHVSIDTVRTAYLKLKEDGYISLSKNVGATVKVSYDDRETERFIQTFFSMRKNAMIDLANSMGPLFGNAQWIGLKHASTETMQAMESLLGEEVTSAPYAMLEHLNQKYCSLGNSLLMRLVWQTFMFLHDPFFSIKENLRYFDQSADYLPEVLTLCRNGDWPALRVTADQMMERLSLALSQFYASRITMTSQEYETTFAWSSYKKSQLCYTFAMELLIAINRGVYPAGSLLPSQKELAKQKGVSLSTVRRALELLGSIGAIKAAKYVGTQILPFDKATENSDFTKPVLQRRLLNMVEGLQVFALSCREVSLQTFSSLDAASVDKLCKALKKHKQWRRGETLSYFVLDLIAKHAPYQTIRIVYSELLLQNFWGYSLRGMKGSQEAINAIYDPYYDEFIETLEKTDFPRFSAKLEELMLYELHSNVNILSRLRIPETENILIPDKSSFRTDEGRLPPDRCVCS
ncbi:GntR family transcriptional regulator [Clostridium sp. D33t1_170424_F3]|uniref:GntR family transcriptional regulator n=1 Tax=Clostridium sp. D33t1_170424_F3 TaxID=2787099 RepID=UPI0018A9E4F3|nr:GntR family transcriptional regulator [Clostridium sp. D33t1_170424_F3]